MKNSKQCIIYTRISTNEKKQRNSLSVQMETCRYFADANGYNVVGEYQEQMSGRTTDRPVLKEAIGRALKEDLFIVVMKVDRLSRDQKCWSIIEPIMPILRFCCFGDNPTDPFVFGILLSVACNEANLISIRTSMAMQKLKREGRSFGNPELLKHQAKAIATRKSNALEYAQRAKVLIDEFVSLGYRTNKSLCEKLNSCSFTTRTGKAFTENNLYRLRCYIKRNVQCPR